MMITFCRTNAHGGVSYYSLHDRQGNLFSRHVFTVHWGRGLDSGREHTYAFESRAEMDRKIRQVIRARLRAGYKVLYSYFRSGEERGTEDLRPLLSRYYVS